MLNPRQAIGVFDSGVGGLTVVKAVRKALPSEDIVYLGDTARVPYGSKSAETVTRYARACAAFLISQDVKMLLIACNTATAHAISALERTVPIPVIGAVLPGAKTALSVSRNHHIGVIGTLGTIRSGAYEAALRSLDRGVTVTGQACALLVPLAEEGWPIDGDGNGDGNDADDIARKVAQRYLGQLAAQDPLIDTLVLGCTHYPLLATVIAQAASAVFAHPVTLVDSADAMARDAGETLATHGQARPDGKSGSLRAFVTDASRLDELAPRFLGERLESYEVVDLAP